jgi:hypothetical protein
MDTRNLIDDSLEIFKFFIRVVIGRIWISKNSTCGYPLHSLKRKSILVSTGSI